MNKTYTQHEVVTVQECRYCDSSRSHHAYGPDEPAVCMSCGAEWEPISVRYSAEELGLWSAWRNDEEEDDSEWNRYFE